MLVAPFAPLAPGSLRNPRLPPPDSCWTERVSHRYTPTVLPLAMRGYACPTPVHGRYTLLAAENTDRYTTGIRPMVRLGPRGSVCPRPMHAPEYRSLRRHPRARTVFGLSVELSAITSGLHTTRNRHAKADLVVTTVRGRCASCPQIRRSRAQFWRRKGVGA